ncbi:potassium transporter-domain-containing protein [Polychytrium aggregatum]|uniref:potassium transporter-domain-containing protein n=1 Tax=Polychytrium aggregatum TaxID=110093 RepID=UPI0022FE1059|nr:potassium transporter-domain-containing protein [Polychytrium aggregatum]KAI9202990.1 potassium transporter-domain-containing protein [Polychytrium aggregatum]
MSPHAAETTNSPKTRWAARELLLSYASLGVVYGDLGTSPLYTLQGLWSQPPTQDDIQGILSLIIWTLTIIIVIKYCGIVLLADDNGEGGTFAIYSLVCRFSGLSVHSKTDSIFEKEVQLTDPDADVKPKSQPILKKFPHLHTALLVAVLLPSCMMGSDGILTPAISVLSAYEGLTPLFPGSEGLIVPLSCITLIALFLVQSYGTHRLANFFSPIILLFILSIGAIGAWSIVSCGNASLVFAAWNPMYAISYFGRNGYNAWASLGGVLLCVTGGEALYADLGHFSRPSLRFSALVIIFPCLLLSYSGLAAELLRDPTIYSNVFWEAVPKSIYIPMLVLSILATIVASQSLISATFSIIYQATAMNSFPPIKVIHTSASVHGQVYVPTANNIMMVLTLLVVVGFGHSARLAAAFGIAVSFVMLMTTFLIAVVMFICWELHWSIIILFVILQGLFDAAFFSSSLLKFDQGGWMPVSLALVVAALMAVWQWGERLRDSCFSRSEPITSFSRGEIMLQALKLAKSMVDPLRTEASADGSEIVPETLAAPPSKQLHKRKHTAAHAVSSLDETLRIDGLPEDSNFSVTITNMVGDVAENMLVSVPCGSQALETCNVVVHQIPLHDRRIRIVRLPGMAMCYSTTSYLDKIMLRHYVEHLPSLFEVMVFISINQTEAPYVHEKDRIRLRPLPYLGFYSAIVTYGYLDIVDSGDELADLIMNLIVSIGRETLEKGSRTEPLDHDSFDGFAGADVRTPHPLINRVLPDSEQSRNSDTNDAVIQEYYRRMNLCRRNTVYVIGRTEIVSNDTAWGSFNFLRKTLLNGMFKFMSINHERSNMVFYRVPMDQSMVMEMNRYV